MSTVVDTVRNGVDTEVMFGTLDAIKAQPELGKFQFRAQNQWVDGAHNRTTIKDFYGAGQEDSTRAEAFSFMASEVSREKPVNYEAIFDKFVENRGASGFILWVIGPALVHARGR